MRDYTKVCMFQFHLAQTMLGRDMGLTLFRNVVPVRAIGIVVSTPEKLAQHWVVPTEALGASTEGRIQADIRFLYSFWLDVPSG